MEKRGNFIALGFFMVCIFLAGIGVILWLNNYSNSDNYKHFMVNTKDSVSGISKKAPVKYRGVVIGEVVEVFINPLNSEEVSIKIRVKSSSPIKEDTYAIIEPQGITGLSYIQLEGGSNASALLKTSSKKPAIIQARASFFTQLNTNLRGLGEKSTQMLDKANKILSEKNIKNIEKILENTAQISQKMQAQGKNIEQFINNANKIEIATLKATKQITKMSKIISRAVENDGLKAMKKMSDAADSVKITMDKAEKKMDEGMMDFKGATQSLTSPLNQTLQRLDILILQTQGLVEQLEKSPSDLLYKHSKQKLGPGEKR